MNQAFDVIVVGAGMVGTALACGLAQAGLQVALLEQAEPEPFDPAQAPDLRVSALSLGSERLLQGLGAWERIQAMRSCIYRRLAVWEALPGAAGQLLPTDFNRTEFDARTSGHSHLGHIVENRVTQWALWTLAGDTPGLTRICPARLTHLQNSADAVRAQLADGRILHAALLVGADGAQSRVRELAHIAQHLDQYAQQAMVATVAYAGPPMDITWQAFYESGPRAFLPLADGQGHSWASLVWYDSAERIAQLRSLSNDALLAAIQRHFPAPLPTLTALHEHGSFPLAKRHVRQYFQGRVALAGDAAHTINPLAGQGVNLGFQDVASLLQQLTRVRQHGQDLADPRLLEAYQRSRRPANQRMIWAMDLFYHGFSNRHLPVRMARNLALATAARLPQARARVARYAMGIDETLPAPLAWLERQLDAIL